MPCRPVRGTQPTVRFLMRRMAQGGLKRLAARYGYALTRTPRRPAYALDLDPPFSSLWSVSTDYVRWGLLQILAQQLPIEGAFAELGVFQGDFARLMLSADYSRDVYLFDTFKGFDGRDISADERREFASRNDLHFDTTSIEAVMAMLDRAPHVHVVPGWFPDSTTQVDRSLRFCLVSLDADLYGPIHSGLEFFVPRLTTPGYILIHDWNGRDYPGVRGAVADFQKTPLGRSVTYVPIPDSGGTIVVAKPAAK